MFACIHSRSVSKIVAEGDVPSLLVDLAFTFSPLVEQTGADTIVFDVAGQGLLFGQVSNAGGCWANIANTIKLRARQLELSVNVSIAANVDAAILAASLEGITIVNAGEELMHLGRLSIKQLDCSLVAVDPVKGNEIQETLRLWGVRTFQDLAVLPLSGVAERLGQEGVRLQKLAQGKTDRALRLLRPPIGFEQSLELEYPVSELEPLSFILSRLLNQLCANLNEQALATNELRLQLVSEPVRTPPACNQTEPAGGVRTERVITLPVPMRNPKTLLRLLLFDIEAHPPPAPIVRVTISAEPIKPRAAQTGLFVPLAPEPEKLEITLARLAKLVGAENAGSPELSDTHRPDAFRVRKFILPTSKKKPLSNPQSTSRNPQSVMGFRIFRPPWRATVHTLKGQPTRIEARAQPSGKVSGKIIRASGPWRASGEWWRVDVWARDEWDVVVSDASQSGEVLCRIYRDLTSEQWFVAGIYD